MHTSTLENSFRLVDKGWDREIEAIVAESPSELRIVCPFIKLAVARRLLKRDGMKKLLIITRFNLRDFATGVSDTSALRLFLKNGAQVRGIKNLHAKLYLFGDTRAILTSANLTTAALNRNHEFGFVANDWKIIKSCRHYFDDLWERAGDDLEERRIDHWDQELEQYLVSGGRPKEQLRLPDEGADAGITNDPLEMPYGYVAEAKQAFIKFFGISYDRINRNKLTLQVVKDDGSHWACTYPKSKDNRRPRQPKDGDIMFVGDMVGDPGDTLIYGRAIAMEHQDDRDVASAEDILEHDWKEKWPIYVRVHHAEFVAGTLQNGVSLNELMHVLGANAFYATQKNKKCGSGNTNPRAALTRKASIKLSAEGAVWVNAQLEKAFLEHGRIPQTELDKLYRPPLKK